jgi:uncharacterized protein
MADAAVNRPTIWVLKGLRAGDTAQAMALALALDGRVETKQLAFNRTSAIPNWLMGARVTHLTPEAQALLRPPWPDIVVATGRRTAPVSLWIKAQSGGRTTLVQIGRPRLPLREFDVVITTPQYGLPAAAQVIELAVPFTAMQPAANQDIKLFQQQWGKLPRPWVLGVVGGAKFPLRLGEAELREFGAALSRHAKTLGGSVILLDSPRSPKHATQVIARCLEAPYWQHQHGLGSNPYRVALQLCDELAVTSDSVSMVTDMLLTTKKVFVFRLPVSAFAVSWRAGHGVPRWLAESGIFAPPRNVDRFMQQLVDQGYAGDLAKAREPLQRFDGQSEKDKAVREIRRRVLA